jgi:hypothetical protein
MYTEYIDNIKQETRQQPQYITSIIWDILEQETTKASQEVLQFLDLDTLQIVAYNGTYWHEYSGLKLPNKKVQKYLDKLLNKLELVYVFNI